MRALPPPPPPARRRRRARIGPIAGLPPFGVTCLFGAGLALLALAAAPPADSAGPEERLSRMERRLRREEMRLRELEVRIARERDSAQRGRLRTETLLRKLDALSGRLALEDQRLRALNRKMGASEERLGQIRAEFGHLRSEQGERRRRIRLRLRALYMEGPIGPVRLLINARSVWDILDRWSLLTQLSRHDLALIKRFRSQEKRLGELEAASEEEVARRAALRERQARVKRRIGRYYGLRARELSRLERSKGKRRKLLDELSGARNSLRDMVASLMRARDAEEAGSVSPLDARMGLLPWPVKGEPLPAEGRGGGKEGGAERADAGERDAYERCKRELAAKYTDTRDYSEAKTSYPVHS